MGKIMDTSGSYIAIAGFVVSILGHYGVVVASNDVIGIIAAIVTLYGIARQFMAHKALAASVGAK